MPSLIQINKKILLGLIGIALLFGLIQSKNDSIRTFYQAEVAERQQLEHSLLAENDTDFTVGAENPKVRLVVYTDTDCPFCQKFEPDLAALLQTYPEDVAITYRHFKLPIYPTSKYEHIALECVGILAGPEKYRDFQNLLLQNTLESIESAQDTALQAADTFLQSTNTQALAECIANPNTITRIENKTNSGKVLGVHITPSWFVTGNEIRTTHQFKGSYRFENLVSNIENVLGEKL
jgi:protein-disulfide isomerase